MKRLFAILISACLLLSLFGCADDTQASLVTSYQERARQHIANGDLDAAIAVLEEGLEKTNQNAELQSWLQQVQDKKTEQATTDETTSSSAEAGTRNIDNFLGFWEGLQTRMEFTEKGNMLSLKMECGPSSLVEHELLLVADISSVEANKAKFPFADDGMGNCGTVTLYLEGDTLNYVITDYVAANDYGIGSFYGGDSLTRCEAFTNTSNAPDTSDSWGGEDTITGEWIDNIDGLYAMTITESNDTLFIEISHAENSYEETIWSFTITEADSGSFFSDNCKVVKNTYGEGKQLISSEILCQNESTLLYIEEEFFDSYYDVVLGWEDWALTEKYITFRKVI